MLQREIFVASSNEARKTTEAFIGHLSSALGEGYHVVPWWQTIWKNLATALVSLQDAVREYDYAIFLCHPDDKVIIRGVEQFQTRDNVIFEFGLFLSVLSTERTFLVRPDNSGPTFRVLSDIGEAVNVPQYKFLTRKKSLLSGEIDIDAASLAEAAKEVGAYILRDVTAREKDRTNAERAKAKLDADLQAYKAQLRKLSIAEASDTRLLNVAGEHIKEFLALKAAATQRSVRDAAEDLGIYFELVDDLLNIAQLAVKQRRVAGPNSIDEVWVFADDPLEFSDEVAGEAAEQIPELRKTIADNLKDDVQYFYFVHDQYKIGRAKDKLLSWRVPEEKFQKNLQFFRLERTAFKTFFTVHKSRKTVNAIYMSAIMKGRNDLLVKVSPVQQNRIYGRLESMIGFEMKNSEGIRHRDFFLDGR